MAIQLSQSTLLAKVKHDRKQENRGQVIVDRGSRGLKAEFCSGADARQRSTTATRSRPGEYRRLGTACRKVEERRGDGERKAYHLPSSPSLRLCWRAGRTGSVPHVASLAHGNSLRPIFFHDPFAPRLATHLPMTTPTIHTDLLDWRPPERYIHG